MTDQIAAAAPPDPALATVIISPFASRIRDGGARARIAKRAAEALGARGHREVVVVEVGTPAAVRHAAADAVRRGSSVVALAGGDGTIRDAAGILAGTGIAVGIVPCGTGNLYASSVGISRDIDEALAALATGSPQPFDVGEVHLVLGPTGVEAAPTTPVTFVVACGTGLDARLIAATSHDMKRRYGVAAYFLAATRLLEHLRAQPTVLTIDDVRTELESVVVLVANCGEAIPGRQLPRLRIDPGDGLLHVFILPRGGVVNGIRGALELMTAEASGVSPSGSGMRLVGSRVRVEVTPAQPTEIDGDPFPVASLDARIRPGALSVLRR